MVAASRRGEAQLRSGLDITPDSLLRDAERVDFMGRNTIAVEQTEWGPMLRSTPRHSATGLYQEVVMTPGQLRRVAWSWLVNPLHRSADIRRIESEDFGATIMFVFGKPSFWNRDVPTLAYSWTSTRVPNGTVLPSLRFDSLRYVQLRGRADSGRLHREERDLVADFESIFGRSPPDLHFVAVFNDNDQTNEPVSALFGDITSTS